MEKLAKDFCNHELIPNLYPEGVEAIGPQGFAYCQNLYSIKLPKSLKSINYEAFRYCSALTTLNLSEGMVLTSMGSNVFGNTALTLPTEGGIRYVGTFAYALSDTCESLIYVFRRPLSENEGYTLYFPFISESLRYRITVTDENYNKKEIIASGKELICGFDVIIPNKRASTVIECIRI